jgi:hypothetical protein
LGGLGLAPASALPAKVAGPDAGQLCQPLSPQVIVLGIGLKLVSELDRLKNALYAKPMGKVKASPWALGHNDKFGPNNKIP